jgi:hypothetical protein
MSLVKEPVMTETNRAAHRQNAQQSRGAATPRGKERASAANLRHGIYSQVRDEGLLVLGEDPAELAALLAGAYEQWRPANQFQASLVERMGRLQWRMQENLTAEHVRKVGEDRHEKTMKLRYNFVDMVGLLSAMQRDALREQLREMAAQEQRAVETAWDPFFARYLKPLMSPERDQAAWESDRTLDLLRRQEESCFRQFYRLGTFLMKIQDRAGVSRGQESKVRRQEPEVRGQLGGMGMARLRPANNRREPKRWTRSAETRIWRRRLCWPGGRRKPSGLLPPAACAGKMQVHPAMLLKTQGTVNPA